MIVAGCVLAWTLLATDSSVLALSPSLEVSQYGHTSWTARDGFALGAVFAMAQTPDGYLWLGSEFGLFHFDGVRFVRWEPQSRRTAHQERLQPPLRTRRHSLDRHVRRSGQLA